MLKDTRDRNVYFNTTDIVRYSNEYAGAFAGALGKVDPDQFQGAADCIRNTHAAGGRIFVGGNGGSASISDHLVCDFTKGVATEKHNGLQVHSLVGSMSLFTAIGNDIGYEDTLSRQLELACANGKDVLILISSSGNSKNIIKAINFAYPRAIPVIGLTGFDGGQLYKLADYKLHVPVNNYGVIEDCHQALMHILAQYHYKSLTA